MGTLIEIEGSEIRKQEPCSTGNGTSITIKNLFFNIPARRNFLKSNSVELRHIIDEFQRQALSHPDVFYSLHNDGNELFHLPASNLKQRIVNLFGANYQERLVPVEESTDMLSVRGFIGKPEHAKRTRGEQFFFVNSRYIKDAYLNHAVMNAFDELLPSDSFPFYILFIEIDPAKIDVNVHPTKTEIKFDDEKILYAVIRATVKRSLGRYSVSPTIDFDTESSFRNLEPLKPGSEIRIPTITVNPDFNPFKDEPKYQKHTPSYPKDSTRGWEQLYEIAQKREEEQFSLIPDAAGEAEEQVPQEKSVFQVHNRFIITTIKSGMMVIDQQAAHERILYECFLEKLERSQGASQQSLFPQNIELKTADFELAKELMDDLKAMGFDLREFGKNSLAVYGIPAEIESGNESALLHGLLENYKQNLGSMKLERRDNLARSLARNAAIKAGKILSRDEMNHLIDELFACQMPQVSINGKSTLFKMTLEDLLRRFDK